MDMIKLNIIGTNGGIQKLRQLSSAVSDYTVMQASGSGSGDVVDQLRELSGTVELIKGTFAGLINGTVACLENYVAQMQNADESIAASMAGEEK